MQNESQSNSVPTYDTQIIDLTDNQVASDSIVSEDTSTLSIGSDSNIKINLLDPNRIRRTLPLRLKGIEPAQCHDVLDEMYSIYYDNEV